MANQQAITLALDAMGGDRGAEAVLDGAERARQSRPGLRFLLVGERATLQAGLDRRPHLAAVASVKEAPEVVRNDDKPAVALRGKRNSSMRLALDAVKNGEADACVSSGNTGALMALAKFVFKTLSGIDRPAIASFFPSEHDASVMLDLGANSECTAENLTQFAVMGLVFDRIVMDKAEPSVGVLNIGSEAMKGSEIVRQAAERLENMALPGKFSGFVEGDDIPKGTVDVVVTDGFTGNVALKTAEGTSRLIGGFIRSAFRRSWMARLGYVFAQGGLRQLRRKLDPRRYNGAMFLGLNGICVKSHGNSDAIGFAHAVEVAYGMAANAVIARLEAELDGAGSTVRAAE